jgi:aerobic carbon-monoxide dehydrogenase medium subunit
VARGSEGRVPVKPAPFDYLAAASTQEAVEALARTDGDARVLAGGQSLVLEMHYRRSRPGLVVDINRVPGLDRLDVDGASLRVGPLVRHRAFESSRAAPGPLGRLLSQTARHIAHPPIRALGTLAGSVAWAHPAAEWCTVATALDAEVELRSTTGTRSVGAADYFHGPHSTARRPDELVTAVRVPLLPDEAGVGFAEHRRTQASFAQVAVVAGLTLRDGEVGGVWLGLANAADTPVRARAAERSLLGTRAGPAAFDRAGRIAADQDADPRPEPHADVEYRRHVVAVLVGRALARAHRDAEAARSGGEQWTSS